MRTFFFLIACSLFWVACQSEPDGSNEPDHQDEYLPDSIDTSGMANVCLQGAGQICSLGIDMVQIGNYIADVEPVGISHIADSLSSESGYVWLVRSLHLEQGRIVLEGPRIEEKLATDTLLSDSPVFLIRVESPRYQTPDQVRVGSTMADLTHLYSDAQTQVFSFGAYPEFRDNPDYEMLEIGLNTQPAIKYLVRDPGYQVFKKLGEDQLALSQLPPQMEIYAIVIASLKSPS